MSKKAQTISNKTAAHTDARNLTEDFGPIVVPGDNRNNSRDSRIIGPIEIAAIKGKLTKTLETARFSLSFLHDRAIKNVKPEPA